jgi:hypothetical protein
MEIVLRKSSHAAGHVEVVEIDGDPDGVPTTMTYESEEAAVNAVAEYLGLLRSEFDKISYES